LLAKDGGIEVDGQMRTSVADVFAAGDVCTAAWTHSPYWLQVLLHFAFVVAAALDILLLVTLLISSQQQLQFLLLNSFNNQ